MKEHDGPAEVVREGECGRSDFNFVTKVVVIEFGPARGAACIAGECHSRRLPNQISELTTSYDLCQQRVCLLLTIPWVIHYQDLVERILGEASFHGKGVVLVIGNSSAVQLF